MSETPKMKRRAFFSLVGAAPLAAVTVAKVQTPCDAEAFAREFFGHGTLYPREARKRENMLPVDDRELWMLANPNFHIASTNE